MGTITITIDGGIAGAATKTFTITNANIGRLVKWSKMNFPDDGVEPAAAAALERWADWVMNTSRQQVLDLERRTTAVADFGVS